MCGIASTVVLTDPNHRPTRPDAVTEDPPPAQPRVHGCRASNARPFCDSREGLDAQCRWRHGTDGRDDLLCRVRIPFRRADHRCDQLLAATRTRSEGNSAVAVRKAPRGLSAGWW